MSRLKSKYDNPFDGFPGWAAKLAERYYTRTVATFLLHGAVRDLQPMRLPSGELKFVPLKTYLAEELFGSRDLVFYYDRSSGVRGATPDMQRSFLNALSGFDPCMAPSIRRLRPKIRAALSRSSKTSCACASPRGSRSR